MSRRSTVRRAPNHGGPDNQAARLLVPALRRATALPVSDELRAVLDRFLGELAVTLDPSLEGKVG